MANRRPPKATSRTPSPVAIARFPGRATSASASGHCDCHCTAKLWPWRLPVSLTPISSGRPIETRRPPADQTTAGELVNTSMLSSSGSKG